ncbi:hypothetical protein D3C73_771690 [compost metagenome]
MAVILFKTLGVVHTVGSAAKRPLIRKPCSRLDHVKRNRAKLQQIASYTNRHCVVITT